MWVKRPDDKIIKMLSKSDNKPKVTFNENVETIPNKKNDKKRDKSKSECHS